MTSDILGTVLDIVASPAVIAVVTSFISFFAGIAVEHIRAKKEMELQEARHRDEIKTLKENHTLEMESMEKDHALEMEALEKNHALEMKAMEKDHALEMEKRQSQWEHEAQAMKEADERDRVARLQAAYERMVDAVIEYQNKHDVNFKSSAEAKTRAFLSLAGNELKPYVGRLARILSGSDPFDGPDRAAVDSALQQIEEYLVK